MNSKLFQIIFNKNPNHYISPPHTYPLIIPSPIIFARGTYKDADINTDINTDYTLSVLTISLANSNKSLSFISILNVLASVCTNLKLLGSLLPPLDNGTI